MLRRVWAENPSDKRFCGDCGAARNEARELLGPVYGWLTEGFDTPDLIEANGLFLQLCE